MDVLAAWIGVDRLVKIKCGIVDLAESGFFHCMWFHWFYCGILITAYSKQQQGIRIFEKGAFLCHYFKSGNHHSTVKVLS
jgi:uncharacterized protein YodC (DUF2158 family)